MSGFCLEFRIPPVACLGVYKGLWSMVYDWEKSFPGALQNSWHVKPCQHVGPVMVIVAMRLLMGPHSENRVGEHHHEPGQSVRVVQP